MTWFMVGDRVKSKVSGEDAIIIGISGTDYSLKGDSGAVWTETEGNLVMNLAPGNYNAIQPSVSASPWITTAEKKCECGVDSLGYGFHSDYCPKYGS